MSLELEIREVCSSSVYLSRTLRQAGREASGPHGPTQTTRLLSPQYNIYTYGIHTQIDIYIYIYIYIIRHVSTNYKSSVLLALLWLVKRMMQLGVAEAHPTRCCSSPWDRPCWAGDGDEIIEDCIARKLIGN